MLNESSKKRLVGLHPDLRAIIIRAAEISTVPFGVPRLGGKRTQAEQDALYAQGRTTPGKIVTWTRNSYHLTGRAVDVVPKPDGWKSKTVSWDHRLFNPLAEAFKAAAKELDVPIEWGGDWKKTKDRPHFQLPRNWQAPTLEDTDPLINRKVFFDEIRQSLFKGKFSQSQVDGITRLLDVWNKEYPEEMRERLAYCLATSYHETGRRMQPVRETHASSDKQAIARLDNAWRKGRLPWVKTPYWRTGWFGRGDVQLTWKRNYERMGELLGVDLVGNPSLALDPIISARILYEGMLKGKSDRGDFTGKSVEQYIYPGHIDFVGARKVVNGTDRARLIAGYAEEFLEALNKATDAVEDEAPYEKPPPTGKPPQESTTIIGALVAGIGAAVAAFGAGILPYIAVGVVVLAAGWIILERVKKSRNEGV
jgi:hypothetical protein